MSGFGGGRREVMIWRGWGCLGKVGDDRGLVRKSWIWQYVYWVYAGITLTMSEFSINWL